METCDELCLELADHEWPMEYIDHERRIVRGIVYDADGFLYFVRTVRDDIFGACENIETSGGGIDPGEDMETALRRELREELGAEITPVGRIGTVTDSYNLLHRRNISTYYLCRAESFGSRFPTEDETEKFHLSVLKLTPEEAFREYERCTCSPLGRLIANRELPVLERAVKFVNYPHQR